MDIVKDSSAIHSSLLKRWEDLDLSQADIVKDAAERGFTITKSALSAYVKHKKQFTQKHIIWLCLRYDIPVQLQVGKAVVVNGGVRYKIEKYNELRALENLKKYAHIFKDGEK